MHETVYYGVTKATVIYEIKGKEISERKGGRLLDLKKYIYVYLNLKYI